MKNAARLITLASIGQILGYAYALPGHIGEATWSHHAQFHLFLSWIWIVGIDIAIMYLAWVHYKNANGAVFWVLLVLFISAQGGHFIASLVEPAGRPPEPWYDYALGTVALIFAIGLGIAWKGFSNSGSE